MKKFDDKSERVQIVAPASWVQRVDEWRRKQADLPNRSDAIRRLVDAAIDGAKRPAKGR